MIRAHKHAQVPDGEPPRLGALESQVMEILWNHNLLAIRDIIQRLPAEPAYTTIATVLTNLRKKELVCTVKDGHATMYRACLAREEYTARIIDHALDDSGDRHASMMHFVKTLSADDLQALRAFLNENEGQL